MLSFERAFVFMLLMLASGAGQGILARPTSANLSEGQPLTQVVFGLFYAVIFMFLLTRCRKSAIFLIGKEKWTVLLALWVLTSTMWSADPGETFRRAVALVGTSMAGLYIGMRYDPKQQVKIIALVVGVGAVASLVAGLLIPSIGFTQDGSWQGIYSLKNSLGRMMALGAMCFTVLALSERHHRALRIGMLVLCLVLMFLSKSATAIVVMMLMFSILLFCKTLYLRTRPLIGIVAVGVVFTSTVGLWMIENADQLLQVLGRNSTLTGRIPLWQLVLKEIAARPLQGYGFSSFWNSWEGERVSGSVHWDVAVPNSHNGFLEIWLGIGMIGLAILLIGMWRIFRSSLLVARTSREIDQSWPLILLVFTVLYNLTESSLLGVNSILWMAYVANSFWLVRVAEEEKYAERFLESPEHVYSS